MGASLTYLSAPLRTLDATPKTSPKNSPSASRKSESSGAVTTIKVDNQPWSQNGAISASAASMQGWRRSMEDAHFMKYFPDHNVYVFGVFDGHGGSGVSRYCAQRFPELLEKNGNFNRRNFDIALHECFMELDEETQRADVQEKLFELHISSKSLLTNPEDVRKVEIHISF
jgi:hypothetical protein